MNAPRLMLRLWHGRTTPDQELDDWGLDGPILGPFAYVHTTYLCDVKWALRNAEYRKLFPAQIAEWEAKGYSNVHDDYIDGNFEIVEDMIIFNGIYYGDWSVYIEN